MLEKWWPDDNKYESHKKLEVVSLLYDLYYKKSMAEQFYC